MPPGDIPFTRQGQSGAESVTWEAIPLTPGTYTFPLQSRTALGSSFCIVARSLRALHRSTAPGRLAEIGVRRGPPADYRWPLT